LLFAPEWLTIEEACFLSGRSKSAMLEIIEEGGIDLNTEELIEKRSQRDVFAALDFLRYQFPQCTQHLTTPPSVLSYCVCARTSIG
jgi:hypothetical protein